MDPVTIAAIMGALVGAGKTALSKKERKEPMAWVSNTLTGAAAGAAGGAGAGSAGAGALGGLKGGINGVFGGGMPMPGGGGGFPMPRPGGMEGMPMPGGNDPMFPGTGLGADGVLRGGIQKGPEPGAPPNRGGIPPGLMGGLMSALAKAKDVTGGNKNISASIIMPDMVAGPGLPGGQMPYYPVPQMMVPEFIPLSQRVRDRYYG